MQYGGRATRLRASESVWSIYIFAEIKPVGFTRWPRTPRDQPLRLDGKSAVSWFASMDPDTTRVVVVTWPVVRLTNLFTASRRAVANRCVFPPVLVRGRPSVITWLSRFDLSWAGGIRWNVEYFKTRFHYQGVGLNVFIGQTILEFLENVFKLRWALSLFSRVKHHDWQSQ